MAQFDDTLRNGILDYVETNIGTGSLTSITPTDVFEQPSNSSSALDLRLKSGASLIGAGADLSGSGVLTDYTGLARSAPYEIGAWETGAAAIVGAGAIALLPLLIVGAAITPASAAGSVALGRAGVVGAATAPSAGTGALGLRPASATGAAATPLTGVGAVGFLDMPVAGAAVVPIVGGVGLGGPEDASAGIAVRALGVSGAGSTPISGGGAVGMQPISVQGGDFPLAEAPAWARFIHPGLPGSLSHPGSVTRMTHPGLSYRMPWRSP